MKIKNLKLKGFTLLEVMVVVAIVSVMSISVVVGFGSLGQSIRLQETATVIEDLIEKLELEIAQGEAEKTHVTFEKDFLVVETEMGDNTPSLSYKGMGQEGCKAGEMSLRIGEQEGGIYLIKKDQNENNLEITLQKANDLKCVAKFKEASENGWSYQNHAKDKSSAVIRFYHFNLNRSNPSDYIQITDGNEYSLEIKGPYAKKQYSKNGVETLDPVILTLKNEAGEKKELILND